MKTIGLLGGMSWESSAHYYRIVNESVRARMGGVHSARSIMFSVDFGEIEALQHRGDWDALTDRMIESAQAIERGGADFLVICTNTMHRMADAVERAIGIPLVHIVDPTAAAIRAAGFSRVGLLGTRFTMEQDFYRGRLRDKHRLDVIVPDADDRTTIHDVIYRELVAGIVTDDSRTAYLGAIDRLVARGAEAVILGCTEIMMLIDQSQSAVPLFDTTHLHALAAADHALGKD